MILQQMVEDVNAVFPQLGITQILLEFDLAQKSLCSEAGLVEESGSLANVTSYISWSLPSDFVSLIQVDLYDSDSEPIYIENLDMTFEVYDGKIHFFSTTSTPLSSLDESIAYIILRYEKMPTDITSINSTLTIDEVEYPAMQALVMKRLYSKVPVTIGVDKEGNQVKAIDYKGVGYWNNEYADLKKKAKQRKNSLDSTMKNAIFYPHAGNTYFLKRNKEASISEVTIPSYESLYSKYVRFSAVSPGSFTEITKIGYGDLTYTMDGNDIVVNSSAEFTVQTWGEDNQNSANAYVSASEFRFTPSPALAWGTAVFEIFDYGD